jgi:glycosyltransferase involved in cell wall biosynthesis
MQLQHRILFLTLRTFSGTGGIEQVSKVAGKAMFEICKENGDRFEMYCMYDNTTDVDTRYFPESNFKGFGKNKWKFGVKSIQEGLKTDLIVLSHINLLLIGYFIKLFSPKTKLILLAHGIEVFGKLSGFRKMMLRSCDQILAVSKFTRETLLSQGFLAEDRLKIVHNCLDPFLETISETEKSEALLGRYGFEKNDILLMSLCRLSSDEGYKGYDVVLEALSDLQETCPKLKYIIVGQYDEKEKTRVEHLINFYDLNDRVVLTGFIPESELANHFQLADIFVMPSDQEGFGIAFIEAMFYRKPVIAGNKDGSVDALLNGSLGVLVNPHSKEEVLKSIKIILLDPAQFVPDGALLNEHFSYPVYKQRWREVLKSVPSKDGSDLTEFGNERIISTKGESLVKL